MWYQSFIKKFAFYIALIAGICTIVATIKDIIPSFINNIQSALEKKQDTQENKNNHNSKLETKLEKEQKYVAYYVPLCKEQIFSIETWKERTTDELYYILNGIYAYEGMRFERNFYDVFEWYDGRIMPEDFPEGILNYYQNKNVANIKKILEERGAR